MISFVKNFFFKSYTYYVSNDFSNLLIVSLYVTFLYICATFTFFYVHIVGMQLLYKYAFYALNLVYLYIAIFLWWNSLLRPLLHAINYVLWSFPYTYNLSRKDVLFFIATTCVVIFVLWLCFVYTLLFELFSRAQINEVTSDASPSILALSPEKSGVIVNITKGGGSFSYKGVPHTNCITAKVMSEIPSVLVRLELCVVETGSTKKIPAYILAVPKPFIA